MNIVFLGGNSARHEKWVHDMAGVLDKPFDVAVAHDYRHWKTGETWIDMDYELTQVVEKTQGFEPYVVFAKSIGTMLALRAMHEGRMRPHACVFLGFPLNAAADMNLPVEAWLTSVNVPVYFLHNEHDPYGSASELDATLPASFDRSRITVLPGDTHDYMDTEIMADLLAKAAA